nr:b(0,+)-type amino acid transporter 1-like [Ciona intestinalis]|eukprot:XP_026696296.1 b(0,+)-type amino acid transporter 1-like [Ciona intestinalis]
MANRKLSRQSSNSAATGLSLFEENEMREISSDDDVNSKQENFELRQSISLAGGVALIAGTMVGSGIFVSPVGVLAGSNGSVGLSLVLWAGCGMIASLASLCYCELGSSIHESGGEYAYLNKEYGSVAAFTFSWTSCIMTRGSGNAASIIVFGNYCAGAFYTGCKPPDVIVKLSSIVILLFLSVLNYVSVSASSKLMQLLTFAKFVAMSVIVVGGMVRLCLGDEVGLNNLNNAFRQEDMAGIGFSQIGLALYQGLWSYEGWNNLNYITEEVKNPKRNLPLAIGISLPLVTSFYILVNISYFAVLTPTEMLASDAVAITWGYRVLGSAGWIMPLSVCLSVIGAVHGSFLTGGRLPFVAARRGHLPQILAMASTNYYSPATSIIFTTILTIIFLIPNDFDTLLNAFSFTVWLFYGSSIAGVIVLRITHPDMPRPYRVPILIPVIMVVIALYLIIAPLIDSPDILILYAAIFIMIAPFVFYICVHKKIHLPGLDRLTVLLQQFLEVAPTDWDKMS